MNMAVAIALSPGNKAETHTDGGKRIVVQERYSDVGKTWLHVWHFRDGVQEADLPLNRKPLQLKALYSVDPDEPYWSSIGG